MIGYMDFCSCGSMGSFIGQLPTGKFLSIETLNSGSFRVWYWKV